MNTNCPYHHQRPPCVLVDVADTLGGEERVHTHREQNAYFVWQPPLRTNAVTYGDRVIAQPFGDHLAPSMVVPGPFLGAFGRIRNKGKAIRALSSLTEMGFLCAWDDEHFGVAFPKNRPELADHLLKLHAQGPLELDHRFIDRFTALVGDDDRRPDLA
jgi:hypothetical protein